MVQHSLESVVREWIIERGEGNMNRFARLFQISVSGLREMNFDTSGVPAVAILDANTTDSINLPIDYVNLIRIAIVDFNGNLQSLGQNDNIALPRWFDACGNSVRKQPTSQLGLAGLNGQPFFNGLQGYADNFRNGECVGRMFGVGGGNNVYGNFRIDKEHGTIVFGNLMTNVHQVVIEYLSDLSVVDGKYMVHPFIIESIKRWISWRDINDNDKRGLGEKQMLERQFYNAQRLSRARLQTHTIQDYLQAFRFANKASVKF